MGYSAKVLADSVSPAGVRLTTMEVTFPRIVLAEFNTHRLFSRNSASSRAIPVERRIAVVKEDPFVPIAFGKNQKGMRAGKNLEDKSAEEARRRWMMACNDMLDHATLLVSLGVHKQITNRLLEPFCWHTVIVSATEWDNFFGLRCSEEAQPEIRIAAELMRDVRNTSSPRLCSGWHMPLMPDLNELIDAGYSQHDLLMISVGRCARVSTLTHDGKRAPDADLALCKRLLENGHMSPFEHVARPEIADGSRADAEEYGQSCCANFRGWVQYRRSIRHEDNFAKRREEGA